MQNKPERQEDYSKGKDRWPFTILASSHLQFLNCERDTYAHDIHHDIYGPSLPAPLSTDFLVLPQFPLFSVSFSCVDTELFNTRLCYPSSRNVTFCAVVFLPLDVYENEYMRLRSILFYWVPCSWPLFVRSFFEVLGTGFTLILYLQQLHQPHT